MKCPFQFRKRTKTGIFLFVLMVFVMGSFTVFHFDLNGYCLKSYFPKILTIWWQEKSLKWHLHYWWKPENLFLINISHCHLSEKPPPDPLCIHILSSVVSNHLQSVSNVLFVLNITKHTKKNIYHKMGRFFN